MENTATSVKVFAHALDVGRRNHTIPISQSAGWRIP